MKLLCFSGVVPSSSCNCGGNSAIKGQTCVSGDDNVGVVTDFCYEASINILTTNCICGTVVLAQYDEACVDDIIHKVP